MCPRVVECHPRVGEVARGALDVNHSFNFIQNGATTCKTLGERAAQKNDKWRKYAKPTGKLQTNIAAAMKGEEAKQMETATPHEETFSFAQEAFLQSAPSKLPTTPWTFDGAAGTAPDDDLELSSGLDAKLCPICLSVLKQSTKKRYGRVHQ